MKPLVRKLVVTVDEVRRELGKVLPSPLRKCAAVAVVENLYAGRYVEDLSLYGEYGASLGETLLEAALARLAAKPEDIDSYGKAAVVGVGGELEHGSALLHLGFDNHIRRRLADSRSLIPSSEKVGSAGCSVDVPLHHKKALKIRSHYDAMEVSVADSPRPGEIMIVLCLSTGSRPFPRIGGLTLAEAKGIDGVN